MVGLPFCHRPPCLRRDSSNMLTAGINDKSGRGYSINTHEFENPKHDTTVTTTGAFGNVDGIKFDGSHERARSAFGAGLSSWSWTIGRNASATVSVPSPCCSKKRREQPFPRSEWTRDVFHERGHVRKLVGGESTNRDRRYRKEGTTGLAGARAPAFNVFGNRRTRGTVAISYARARIDYVIFPSWISWGSLLIFARNSKLIKSWNWVEFVCDCTWNLLIFIPSL